MTLGVSSRPFLTDLVDNLDTMTYSFNIVIEAYLWFSKLLCMVIRCSFSQIHPVIHNFCQVNEEN